MKGHHSRYNFILFNTCRAIRLTILAIVALLSLIWLLWQLIRAKHFNRFKRYLHHSIKPQIITAIAQELTDSRSPLTPNSAAHIKASQYYWSQYSIRILQAALSRNIITEAWLKETGNWRNCQHLFFIEQQFKAELVQYTDAELSSGPTSDIN